MLVLALGGLAVVFAWQSGELSTIRDQSRVWARGVKADVADVRVEEQFETASNRWFFARAYHYVVRAKYAPPGTEPRERSFTFSTALRSIDSSRPVELRYDASAPDRFAVSWTVERLGSAAALLAFKWLLGALWAATLLWVAALEFLPTEAERAARSRGREEAAPGFAMTTAAGLVLIAVASAGAAGLWMLGEDIARRWDSYLEVAIGLLLAIAIIAVVTTIVGTRAIRRRPP